MYLPSDRICGVTVYQSISLTFLTAIHLFCWIEIIRIDVATIYAPTLTSKTVYVEPSFPLDDSLAQQRSLKIFF